MKNRIEIRGDTTALFLKHRNGETLETLIDTKDLPLLQKLNISWRAIWDPKMKKYYVQGDAKDSNGKYRSLKLHRYITQAPAGMQVDHINRDTLDNQRDNLRIVTDAQNKQNRGRALASNKSCGIRGVSWHSLRKKWRAHATLNGKFYHLGLFKNIEEAEQVVLNWRRQNMPFSAADKKVV